MLKKFLVLATIATFIGACTTAELQRTLGTILDTPLTDAEVGAGLKEALNQGIGKGSDLLSQKDGYFKSPYKILLPPEARKVTDKLKNVPGFSDVENIVLEKINRGAEDAAIKAKPIFVSAIKQMTFKDVMGILLGEGDAATTYLQNATSQQLYQEFNPVIVTSLDKFEARKYWTNAVNTYNKIPFIEKANPDLDDYVTQEALKGLFAMVEKEERNIRDNIAARTTDLMRKVFARQDKK